MEGKLCLSKTGGINVACVLLLVLFQWLQCMPELELRSMLSETVTKVSLTQGARAQEWPPAPWPLVQPSLSPSLSPTPTPAWAPGRARTPVFAASGVWAAAPSEGWIWGKETKERRTPQLQIEASVATYHHTNKTTTTTNQTSWLQFRRHLSVCDPHINLCLATSAWDYWFKHLTHSFYKWLFGNMQQNYFGGDCWAHQPISMPNRLSIVLK